jgi:diguanylate cyclase (GGDEF)-like protein
MLTKEMADIAMLLCQAAIYFACMASLFRARRRLGLGVFVCTLGVMHFLETYLASEFFIELPFGLISPGSVVLFSGKLAMILLLYIREDAESVRQPIYGLLIGNFLMVAIVALLHATGPAMAPDGHQPDLVLIDQIGVLMIWGTFLLFADSIGIVLLYERLHRVIRSDGMRAFACLVLVLTFDQLGFFAGLHVVAGTPLSALFGGWVAKMGAAAAYSVMMAIYLRYFERTAIDAPAGTLTDVFSRLTYRRRYEELLGQSSTDALTGALTRRQFDEIAVAPLRIAGDRPFVSLAIIDLDNFKEVNDRHGHVVGDEMLKGFVAALKRMIRANDRVYRYGGDEFVLICEGLTPHGARSHAERLRQALGAAIHQKLAQPPSVSIGLACYPGDGLTIGQLFAVADARLYEAKNSGRNRVVGPPAD